MAQRYRHEIKYLIRESDREALRLRMNPLFMEDAHAGTDGYMVRSLYFDDYWDSAYEDKENGIMKRAKWRIRIYNCSDSSIRMERKIKTGSYICKESAALTREEVYRILEGDVSFLLSKENELLKTFYVEYVSKVLRPRVIVDYDRIPYILPEGTVRVTFDSGLRTAILSDDIFDDRLPELPCMEDGKCIMEVKYTEFLPGLVKDILPAGAADLTAMSKYTICAEKTGYLHGNSYYAETEVQKL